MTKITLRTRIDEVLSKIRTQLKMDGGDIELVDVKDGTVSVHLTGACVGCPMASLTLQGLVERMLKEQVSEVKEVIAV